MFRVALFGSMGVAAAVLLALGVFLALPGKKALPDKEAPAEVEVEGTTYQIRGPFTHRT